MEKVVSVHRESINLAYWRGRNVLITGHSGFKGSWLTFWLNQLGSHVTGLSLAPAIQPSLFDLAGIPTLCKSYLLDIRDKQKLKCVFDKEKPEVVFHLAAQSLVRPSYVDPVETFSTNIMGTINVLEALRLSSSVKAAVMITSDKVYRNHERSSPYKEQDCLGGHDPYSCSKASCELVIDSYRNSYLSEQGVNVASARAGNVIGGGDWAIDRLVPDAIRAWSDKRILSIRNPHSVRPWQHVLEPLRGYIILAQKLASVPQLAGAYNFGPDFKDAASVRHVIEMAQASWGYPSDLQWESDKSKLHESVLLRLDTSKSQDDLGIKPVWDIATAIQRTVDWYKKQYQGENALTLCKADIEEFSKNVEVKNEQKSPRN
jgi:CDP-glucose 4,6-dehydratase